MLKRQLIMAIQVAIILAGISIGLLVIYGIDVAIAQGNGVGFLPFDEKARGYGLGGPSMILPIIAYFISKKEPSKGLGILLLISAGLIIAGGAIVLAISDPVELEETGRNIMSEAIPLFAVGGFIIALGILKLKKS